MRDPSEHRLRILFFTLEYEPGFVGGAELQARLQAQELVRRGHRVCVVCPRTPGQRTGVVGGIKVWRLPRISRPLLRKPSYALALVAWLLVHSRRFDIWHVHLASRQADWVVVLGALLRRPTYVKVACGGSTGEIRMGDRSAWWTRRAGVRMASRVQALSGAIAAELELVGVSPERIVRVPNGLDLTAFSPAQPQHRRTIRHKLGLPIDAPIVLYTGRFAEYKGVGDLLHAWPSVASETDGLLVLVGARGKEDRPLSVPVAGPSVVVRPWTSAVVDYLHAADVYVHPAHEDGMSNALLEAMACGLAPVATGIAAVQGLLEDEHNALLVAPFAPRELSEALLRVLRDVGLRNQIASAAAQTARQYSVKDVVSRIELTYGELIGSSC